MFREDIIKKTAARSAGDGAAVLGLLKPALIRRYFL